MLVILVVSFFLSAMMAVAAYLQTFWRWWQGPAIALGLLTFGILVAVVVDAPPDKGAAHPAITLGAVSWGCALIVLLGSIAALVLRPYMAAKQITCWVFAGGFMTTCLAFFAAALG